MHLVVLHTYSRVSRGSILRALLFTAIINDYSREEIMQAS